MLPAMQPLPQAAFCLGGIIYPWDHEFDWTDDLDVLLDVLGHTYAAIMTHHTATMTRDRDWLVCACASAADHRDQLIDGWRSASRILWAATPLWTRRQEAKARAPMAANFLRAYQ